jgi:hypothetical protein
MRYHGTQYLTVAAHQRHTGKLLGEQEAQLQSVFVIKLRS